MQLIDSTKFFLAFLWCVLIFQFVVCQADSNLLVKLKSKNSGIEASNKLTLTNKISNNLLNSRVKRQYFKPPIDGSWFANPNEKATNLGAKRRETSTYEIKADSTSSSNNKTQKRDEPNQVTVTSLSISLINLFDRVKETLCNLINTNCSGGVKLP